MDSILQNQAKIEELSTAAKIEELRTVVKRAPSLVLMIFAVLRLAMALAVKIVEAELKERADQPCSWPRCPQCNARIENRGRKDRQLLTLIGIIHWRRKTGRCPNGCQIGLIVPLDDQLGLKPNQRVSLELQKVACALAIFVPYQLAAVLLKMLTGVEIPPQTIWNWVQEVGKKAMVQLEIQLHALQAGIEPRRETLSEAVAQLMMIIGADGVMVPFRPYLATPNGKTVWYEVKVGIFARLVQRISRYGKIWSQVVHRRLVAVLGNKEDLRQRMELEAIKQGIRHVYPVVWVSDGGPAFWGVFQALLQLANWVRGILDFYHAAQNLWKAASTWLDGRTQKSRQWFGYLRHLLRHGQPCEVLREISKPLSEETNLSESAQKALENLQAYLCRHYQHISYASYKDMGYPLGSGIVESACKWLIQQRFKGVGMRWSKAGFNHLLHLRLAWVNGRFDELFDPH